jgi:hypothetical protein
MPLNSELCQQLSNEKEIDGLPTHNKKTIV